MFAFSKRRHFAIALLFGLSLVLPIFFFTFGKNQKNNLPAAMRTAGTSGQPSNVNRPASVDADNDGLPDVAEIQTYMDRESFRRWFTLIAEAQFYELSNSWNAEQRDCAGLVRFAWREALRRHDRLWFQKMGPRYTAIGPDVRHYNLEESPLGEKLFRAKFGAYKEGDLTDGTFSEFADARTLKTFNAKFISRDRQQAEPGDLLFFYQPWVQKFPYHVMIFLGDAKLTNEKTSGWVVYHTGSSPGEEGTIKKVALHVLDQHPNRRWRPIESNQNFLGFYRLKILD
jgi:uncharacterized protein